MILALLLAQLAGQPGQIQTPNAGRWTSQQGTFLQSGTGAQLRTIESKLREPGLSVLDFGCKGDGATDDTTCIRNTIAAAVAASATGGSTPYVYFPAPYIYRVTDQIVIGARFVSEDDVMGACDGNGTSCTYYPLLASYSASGYATAVAAPLVSLIGQPGAIIWGNFTSGSGRKAILYYGAIADWTTTNYGVGKISGLIFVGNEAYVGGVFTPPSNPTNVASGVALPGTQHQVGVFIPNGMTLTLDNLVFRELDVGLLATDHYWTSIRDSKALHCNNGFVTFNANATVMSDLLAYNARQYGFRMSGQQWRATGINSEHSATDLYIPSGQYFNIDGVYFENSVATDTNYGIILGKSADATIKQVFYGDLKNMYVNRTPAGGHSLFAHNSFKVIIQRSNLQSPNTVVMDSADSQVAFEESIFSVIANGNQTNAFAWDRDAGDLFLNAGRAGGDLWIGAGNRRLYDDGTGLHTNSVVYSDKAIGTARVVTNWAASVTIDASAGNLFEVPASSNIAHTVAAPTNPSTGQLITVRVKNTSGGALAATGWNAAFKMAAWVDPGNGFSASIDFVYDGTNWVEKARGGTTVPN
jgi:hypothetical protein